MVWPLILLGTLSLINIVTALASFKKEHIPSLQEFPDVTIICRTWDDDHIVERFIKGCLNQNYRGKIQIILADDASSDKTSEIAKKYKGKIKYIRSKKHHKWKALFLNPIIKKHAKGAILINTDIDAVLPTNYVTEMVRYLQKYDAVSSVCVGGNPETPIAKARILEDAWLYGAGMKGRSVLMGKAAMYGGSHAVWMDVLKEVGYYGTKTMTEDAELTVTLNKKGYKTGFCDSMVVLLEDVETLEHYLNERKRWIYGPMKISKEYGALQAYNLLFLANMLLNLVAIISLILSFFNPAFLIPFGISIATHIISLMKLKAKPRVYFWIPYFLFLHPVIELVAFLGILKDILSGKGVRWVKVSGKKYHTGSELKPIFKQS